MWLIENLKLNVWLLFLWDSAELDHHLLWSLQTRVGSALCPLS